MASSSKSSFSAFNDVDESVSKPVLGSDGAARWQDFKGNNKIHTNKLSVAPAIPLKKLDRVGLGTTSIRDEQANEAKIRKEAGDRELGAGYTVFKRKSDHEEIAEKKRKKLILERVRPDDMSYFIEAENFEGYKFDYVFTSRDTRGIGYYWDGMDSLKKEMGLPPTISTSESAVNDNNDADATNKSKPKKKKKKRKIHESEPIFEVDEFNPMEQVAQAILRRKQASEGPPSSLGVGAAASDTTASDAAALGADKRALNLATPLETLEPKLIAAGWESAKDASSGKVYYFKRSTNETSWKKPALPATLPNGWKETKDKSTGKTYYYHTSGKTSWSTPTI